MIEITPDLRIDERELTERFTRAPGPGGQNVNKLETAVQLSFDVRGSPSLTEPVKARLLRLAGRRADKAGVVTIDAHRYRTRERNRADAQERLLALIRRALHAPKPRQPTRPTRAAKARRVEEKRQRARTKQHRGPVDPHA
ncbi:MAG: aminoacyl-tRNA hydrolase [Chromatiaceae bacterium]|nr:MAG: aminoacyl-tRNA hydrolase [Chromatiaceae bacterium]